MIPRRSKVGSISVATARRELARRESERRAERLSGTRAARPPPYLPDLSRSRPKSFRRGTAIDHIVSFPSPSSIGGASDGRTDGRSKAERSGAERGPGSRLPFRLFDVARPTLVNGHGVFGSGKQLGPVVAYITIRMADRSKTSAPTYPPVAPRFTHTHTHTCTRARFLRRVHAIAHPFASINVCRARPRSSTLSTSFQPGQPENDRIPLSCTPPSSHPLRFDRLPSFLFLVREANEEWKESGSSAYRNGKNGEIGGGWTRRSNAAGGETKAFSTKGVLEISEGERNGRTTNW